MTYYRAGALALSTALSILASAGLGGFAMAQDGAGTSQPAVEETQEAGLAPPPGITNDWVMEHYREKTAEFAALDIEPGATVMLGDSITEWGDWDMLLPTVRTANFGIAGDIAEGVALRLDQVIAVEPGRVFLKIGTNDLPHGLSPEEIAEDVAVSLDRLAAVMPGEAVFVQSVLPREAQYYDRIQDLNARLEQEAYARGMWYVPLHDAFLGQDGRSMEPTLSEDGLHLNPAGYEKWVALLQPYLDGFQKVPDTDIVVPAYYQPGGKLRYAQRVGEFAARETAPGQMAFVGDSITEGANWGQLFPARHSVNFGVGWDQTGGLLNRLVQIEQAEPSRVFLLIGTNDIGNGRAVADAADNIREAVQRLKMSLAPGDIILQSVLPREAIYQADVTELNARLRRVAVEEGVQFLNIYDDFLVDDALDPAVTEDGLHLTQAGYDRWRTILAPFVETD